VPEEQTRQLKNDAGRTCSTGPSEKTSSSLINNEHFRLSGNWLTQWLADNRLVLAADRAGTRWAPTDPATVR